MQTNIKKHSSWQGLYVVGFMIAIVILALCADLPVLWIIVVLMVCMILSLVILFTGNQLMHLTAADINNSNSKWQLLYAGRTKPVLWEAELLNAKSYTHCVQLTFLTVYPRQVKKTVMVWQDQVEAATWRQLQVRVKWS